MAEKYGLSDKYIKEQYEDLLFRKVMAKYAENESRKVEEEITEEKGDSKKLSKLFAKKERRETAKTLYKYGKKLTVFVAMVVLAGVISVSTAVYAFEDVRENVAEYLYSMVIKDLGNKLDISSGWSADPRSQRYILSYVPKGFNLVETTPINDTGRAEYYRNGKDLFFDFNEVVETAWKEPDARNNDNIEISTVNGKSVYLTEYDGGYIRLEWLEEDAILEIYGPAEMRAVLFDIMRGVIQNEKYEGERIPIEIIENPEETYPETEGLSEEERLGLHNYDNKGAWMPTYIPEGFACDGGGGSSSGAFHVVYRRGTDYIIIDQRGENFFSDSEEGEVYIDDVNGYYVSGEELYQTVWAVDETIITVTSNVEGIIFDIAWGMVPSEYVVEVKYDKTRYMPSYIPEGFEVGEEWDDYSTRFVTYRNGEAYFGFSQMDGGGGFVSAENDDAKIISVWGSEALYVKKDEWVAVCWYVKNEQFEVFAEGLSDEEIFKIIDGLVPIE